MRRFKFHALVALTVLTGWAVPLRPQSAAAEDDFNRALILYRNRDYEQAKVILLAAAARSDHPQRTASLYLLAKTFEQLQDDGNAQSYADRLIRDYPGSRYRPYAHFLKGRILYQKNDLTGAFSELIWAVETAGSVEFQRRCEAAATEVLRAGIAPAQFELLYGSHPWKNARPILNILRIQLTYQAGESSRAATLADEFLASKPEPRYRLIAEKLKEQVSQKPVPPFRVGVIMPVSGYFAEEAREFLAGAGLALSRRKSPSPPVEVLLGDSQGSTAETVKLTLDLLEKNINVVIGELEGDKSAVIAGMVQQSGTPLLIPTATDDGLTVRSRTVFQLNSPLKTRTSALAEFAVRTLGMRTFAVLAPEDDYGRAMASSFVAAVKQQGGIIITQQWFHPDSSNFMSQIEAIREAGFRYGVGDSLRKTGRAADQTQVDAEYDRLDRNSRYRSPNRDGLVKNTKIALRSIDGLFVPMYEEHIPFLASQLALYNIKAGLLSGDRCYNLELLREQQQYLDKMIFVSGYYFSDTDFEYTEFADAYRQAVGVLPGPMAAYGYNVMNLLLEAVESGITTKSELIRYLADTDDYFGIGTMIKLKNADHVNQFVNILQFLNGDVYRMNELK